jgi:hypothetical protein
METDGLDRRALKTRERHGFVLNRRRHERTGWKSDGEGPDRRRSSSKSQGASK